ncbi:hypothetical protein C8J56DRAFT_301491 [Mycena floridula]|nr:hypothetical protein C8J56DRAFT_301491 [Mycena floridula]
MLRATNPPPDIHKLLGERAIRARGHQDLGSYNASSSKSLSELSDTPSIYSRAFFSPRPDDELFPETYNSPSSFQDQGRNHLNDLAVSMLEQDSELQHHSDDEEEDEEEDDDAHVLHDDNDQPLPRMSLLGPKMRFHTKAPWLEDTVPEDDESEIMPFPRPLRPSNDSRPSGESVRSQAISSYTLPQGSRSSSSLVSPPQSGGRAPFSFGRIRSYSPSPTASPRLSPATAHSSYFTSNNPPSFVENHRMSNDTPTMEEESHPYANPDFALTSHDPIPFPRSESSTTVTDSATSSSLLRSMTQPELNSRQFVARKEISSPISVQASSFNAQANGMAGWTDRVSSPPITLISLEEARSQRTRSSTFQPQSTSSRISASSGTSFPQSADSDTYSTHSPNNTVTSRARARSISAGARAKQAFHNIVGSSPIRGDSEPVPASQPSSTPPSSAKSLKHKKSGGFLRLFNGRDDKEPPPPVPSLSDGYNAFNAQQSAQKVPRISTQRVPVPTLSTINASPESADSTKPSPKRIQTSLSINVPPVSYHGPASATRETFLRRPERNDAIPQSAPPHMSEFPSLKLRPVSTMFSNHFAAHIIPQEPSISPDAYSDTPSSLSPSTVVSPITPNHPRSDRLSGIGEKPASVLSTVSEDQSSVIRTLQEQIVSAKKAWQRHIWELEGQVRDLKSEVEELRAGDSGDYCETCGRGEQHSAIDSRPVSVVNRPRPKIGTSISSRFGV